MAEIKDLEAFIDNYHKDQRNMQANCSTPQPEGNPSKRKKNSSTDTNDLQTTEIEVFFRLLIKKFDLLVTLHNEIKELRASLEFAHIRSYFHYFVAFDNKNGM